jgi:hypothetical protein
MRKVQKAVIKAFDDLSVLTPNEWKAVHIPALRQLLEQSSPVQEPVLKENSNYRLDPPEAEPAQRQWVGLTDEEIAEIYLVNTDKPLKPEWLFARAIEAKLKEKNT